MLTPCVHDSSQSFAISLDMVAVASDCLRRVVHGAEATGEFDVSEASALVWALTACVMDARGVSGPDKERARNLLAKRQAAKCGVLQVLPSLLKLAAAVGHQSRAANSQGWQVALDDPDAEDLAEGAAWCLTWLTRWSRSDVERREDADESSTVSTDVAVAATTAVAGGAGGDADAATPRKLTIDDRDILALQAGCLPELCALLVPNAWASCPAAACAASYALSQILFSSERARQAALDAGAVELLGGALRAGHEEVESYAATALANLCVTRGDFATRHHAVCSEVPIVRHLIGMAQHRHRRAQQRAVLALSFLAQSRDCCDVLLSEGAERVLAVVAMADAGAEAAKVTEFAVEKATCAIAYLLGAEETATSLLASMGAVECITRRLKEAAEGDESFSSAREMALALQLLAINDENKASIVKAGAIPVLAATIGDARVDSLARAYCVLCIERLCFDSEQHHAIIDEPGLVDELESVAAEGLGRGSELDRTAVGTKATNNEFLHRVRRAKRYAQGALFMLGKVNPGESVGADASASGGAGEAQTCSKHVMISYSWAHQPTILRLKDELVAAGYNVWLDTEQMRGSTLEAMAEAVDNACVVLFTMSAKYKESANCRLEAEYAQSQKKVMVPINMDPRYRCTGWLGMIVGSKLWYDFSGEPDTAIKRSLKPLLKELDAVTPDSARRASVTPSTKGSPGRVKLPKADPPRKPRRSLAAVGRGRRAAAKPARKSLARETRLVRAPPAATIVASKSLPAEDVPAVDSGDDDKSGPHGKAGGSTARVPTARAWPPPEVTAAVEAGKRSHSQPRKRATTRSGLTAASTPTDVAEWLFVEGLEYHEAAFVGEKMCGRAVTELLDLWSSGAGGVSAASAILQSLGITTVGERLRVVGSLRAALAFAPADGDETTE